MISFFKKLWRDRRGNALIIAAAALPLVVGSAGLASDTIQWALWKRQLQRAADSAAIAGVYAKVQNNAAVTPSIAVDTDLTRNNHVGITLESGYPNVTQPGDTSTYTNAVRVQLAIKKTLGFSSLFMSSAPTIIADATAATIKKGIYCVVSLEDTSATGITASGNGDINMGCGMITNSTSINAAIATGSAEVYATPIAAVGDIQASDNWNSAELLPFTVKEKDPFADVPVPPFTPCQSDAGRSINSVGDHDFRTTESNKTICLSDFDAQKGNITLGDNSIYVIDKGDFEVGSSAHLTCNGCTIVLTNSDATASPPIGNVKIDAGPEIDMKAPTSGTYDGILFYQDRRASSGPSQTNKINGNSDSLMEGAFYFPTRNMVVNGSAGLKFTCAQFVARVIDFSGNGSITNTCSGYGDDAIYGDHVRLIA